MNRGPLLFLGLTLTFASAWLGLVLLPFWQLNALPPQPQSLGSYPQPLTEAEAAGRKIYQANGCVYCHSQQVRSQHFGNGADLARGWGQRRTVPRDYLYDAPVMLGTMRTGPDLATIGERTRNPSASWHHEHLFQPKSKNEWSIMPSFHFLYERVKVAGTRNPKAMELGREWTMLPGKHYDPPAPANEANRHRLWLAAPEEEYEIVPTAAAESLVSYLLSLKKTSVPLPEADEP